MQLLVMGLGLLPGIASAHREDYIALGHLVRLLKHAQVIVGSHTIPLWSSAPLAVIAALLSFWMWKLSK